MPSRIYNTFYKWVQQDDFLTNWANFIEHDNVTWLRTGYGITLWPKVQKQIETTEPMNWVLFRSWANLNVNYPYWDNWEIYRLTGTDLIPEFTLLNWLDIVNAERWPSNYFFVTDWGIDSVAQIAIWFADWWNFAWNINESFITSLTINKTPAMLRFGSLVYIGTDRNIQRIDNSLVVTSFWNIASWNVIWMSLGWTTIKVYNDNWQIQFWDGSSTTFSSSIDLWFRISRVVSQGSTDFITSEDWDFYIMSGYNSQRLLRAIQSNRLEDNSQYIKKVNFVTWDFENQTLESAKWDVYMLSWDSVKGIYQYGNIIEWLAKGIHKVITKDHLWIDFTTLNSLKYFDQPQKLFICSTSASWNFVQFAQLDDLTTSKDWFAVTDIFTGWTTFNKQLDRIRLTTSFTSGSNFVKLYMRLNNNSSWSLLQTINNTTDEIKRDNISLPTGNFVDIQFKLELHNDNQDNTPPIAHELMFEYTIIQK